MLLAQRYLTSIHKSSHRSSLIRSRRNFSSKDVNKTFRYPIPWKDPEFYDEKSLEEETRRVFDVCHGCRLCYSLCGSFPKLFDIIDEGKTGELDSIPSSQFKEVVDDCTLCDACFLSKCPYVPPHGLNIDFPHLMLRYKAVENMKKLQSKPSEDVTTVAETSGYKMAKGNPGSSHVLDDTDRTLALAPTSFIRRLFTNMDLMGTLGLVFAPLMNWATRSRTPPTIQRVLMEDIAGIHRDADLPNYVPKSETLVEAEKKLKTPVNTEAKAFGKKKVVLFGTCNVNSSNPQIGLDTIEVLRHNGIDTQVQYKTCCGMPQLEGGNLPEVERKAKQITEDLLPYIELGYDILVPVASCGLMLKKEWPLLIPEDEVCRKVSENTYDVSEYVVKLNKEGLLEEITDTSNYSVTLHHACHARSQSMGFKSNEMLSLIPNLKLQTVDRCSGHGGSFGVMKEHHKTALKVGRPVFSKAVSQRKEAEKEGREHIIVSDCPLAAKHIKQGVHNVIKTQEKDDIHTAHPIQILAKAYANGKKHKTSSRH